MSTTARRRRPPTEEEREERHARDQKLVAEAVESLRSSEGWQAWLKARSRFHKYSIANQYLIAWQNPNATHVASFKKWLELGYVVQKGSKAIRIWAPVPPSKKTLEQVKLTGDEAPRTYFRLVPVFAQDQVEPLPPPAVQAPLSPPSAPIEGNELEDRLPVLAALAGAYGVEVAFESVAGSPQGYYSPREKKIVVDDSFPKNSQLATLVHEMAHLIIAQEKDLAKPKHWYGGYSQHRAEEEMIVESVSLTVCGSLGLDTSGFSIAYVASWAEAAKDASVITEGAALVHAVATKIEEGLGL